MKDTRHSPDKKCLYPVQVTTVKPCRAMKRRWFCRHERLPVWIVVFPRPCISDETNSSVSWELHPWSKQKHSYVNSGKSWKAVLEWTAITRGWWFPHTLPPANYPLFAWRWFPGFFCFRWSQLPGEVALTYLCLSLPPYFFDCIHCCGWIAFRKWALPALLSVTQRGLLSGQDNFRWLYLFIQWILHLIS